jgi:proteasome accessory factor A
MKKRIFGIETEYGIVAVDPSGKWLCEQGDINSRLEYLRANSNSSEHNGKFLANGSRLYVDAGNHPEYASAECASVSDAVVQDKAGERILRRIFDRVNAKVLLFKNNVQYAINDQVSSHYGQFEPITFGCHENFLMEERVGETDLSPVFLPFLVVRQIISGSGWVADPHYYSKVFRDPQSIRYVISQRTRFIGEAIGSQTRTQWQRPILCTARFNEPHAESSRYKRLHLILSDSNMSELSAYLKMGTVAILLEMVEEGYPFDELKSLQLVDSVRSLHLVSFDLSCKKPVIELDSGKLISAIDLFREYVAIMDRYQTINGLNPELSDVLARVKDALGRFEKREIDQETLMEIDSQGLDKELDWLMKKSLLESSLRKLDCYWNNFFDKRDVYEHIRAKDLKFHEISKRGIYNIAVSDDLSLVDLKALGARTPRIAEDQRIEDAVENPPQDTRAKLRGDFIRFLEGKGAGVKSCFSMNWEQIYSSAYRGVNLSDPFATENESLDRLYRSIT